MTEQPADPITSMISHLTKPESNPLLIQVAAAETVITAVLAKELPQ